MKIFFPVSDGSVSREDIYAVIRSLCEKQFLQDSRTPEFPEALNGGGSFLIKRSFGLFWGKVFFESFTPKKFEELEEEFRILEQKHGQKIQASVFSPRGVTDLESACGKVPADYFQYSIINACGENAMLIERSPLLKTGRSVSYGQKNESSRSDYSFSKQSLLTRNELAELIDLSLDLKRL